jgi:hypothetical protein
MPDIRPVGTDHTPVINSDIVDGMVTNFAPQVAGDCFDFGEFRHAFTRAVFCCCLFLRSAPVSAKTAGRS